MVLAGPLGLDSGGADKETIVKSVFGAQMSADENDKAMKKSGGIVLERHPRLEIELLDNLLVRSEVALAESKEANLRSNAQDDAKTLEDGRSQAMTPQVHDGTTALVEYSERRGGS